MIRITSKRHGFRRCGVAHPAAPTEYPDDRFTEEELARLQAEPMLTVEVFQDAPADESAHEAKRKGKSS
ncbi:MAG TPA: HI1506-related protein [Methylococcus sp.]|nr:HI1506-related protein [Methylococcus sp.]